MKYDIDGLLRDFCGKGPKPSHSLNQSTLQRMKESGAMNYNFRKTAVAAAVGFLVLAGGASVTYAAYHYLSPSEVARQLGENEGEQTALSRAFESKGAILVNETQSSNGYDITLLGLVSGKGLSSYVTSEAASKLEDIHTYAVVAIAHTDGTAMEEDYKCVSPLINGVDWTTANNGTLDTGLTFFEMDGVVYHLIECDNLEVFADRGVQLGVVESFGNENSAFSMDKSGVYCKNPDYKGMSALFSVPFDKSKADPKAVEEYMKKWKTKLESGEEDAEEEKSGDRAYDKFVKAMDRAWDKNAAEFLAKHTTAVKGSRQILPVDKNGQFHYESREGGSGTVSADDFEVGIPVISHIETGGEGDNLLENAVIIVFTLNEDGTVTYEEYVPDIV